MAQSTRQSLSLIYGCNKVCHTTGIVPQIRAQAVLNSRLVCLACSRKQYRYYQRPPEKPGLFRRFLDNIREGLQRDKQMQENIKKFQEEAKKYEESEALKAARDKLSIMGRFKDNVSPYAEKVQQGIKSSADTVSETFGKMREEAMSSELYKKSQEISEELSKSAKDAASKLSQQSEEIEKTEAFKNVSKVYSAVKSDLFDEMANASRPYQRPEVLKRRTGVKEDKKEEEKVIEADTESTGVVLHKESKWSQQWKDFKDNNPVVNGLFSLKMKYDESDNVVVRASRFITDKLGDVFKDVFSQSDTAATLAEIAKIDPSFNKEAFLRECEFEIIPTVLEAFIRGDVDVLQDWCHEAAFNILSTQIKHNMATGTKMDSKILDIRDVDLAMAKIMEQGPVLILTFVAQQIMVVRDSRGKILEGNEDKIENVHYIWAMCRDQTIYDPRAAWRVLEFGIQHSTPWV